MPRAEGSGARSAGSRRLKNAVAEGSGARSAGSHRWRSGANARARRRSKCGCVAASTGYTGRRAGRKASRRGSIRGRSALSAGRAWNTSILCVEKQKLYTKYIFILAALASQRTPKAEATAEEAGEGGASPSWPDPDNGLPCFVFVVVVDMSVLLTLALVLLTRAARAAAILASGYFVCSSARGYPRGGIGSRVLDDVGTPYRRY